MRSPTAKFWKGELIAKVLFKLFLSTKHIYMDTNTDHFTPLALCMRGNNNNKSDNIWEEISVVNCDDGKVFYFYSILYFNTDAPAPPQNLSIQVFDNTTTASWSYQRIETVNVSFHLSLTFSEPSKLQTLTTEVTDLQSHTFTLDGVRSCDNFIFCISGRNMAGQGNNSCINGSFPYILQADMIKNSLSRTSETLSLNVTVMVRWMRFSWFHKYRICLL